jgi:hypothetical protein
MSKKFKESVEQLLITRHDWMSHEGFMKPYDRSDETERYLRELK